MVGSRRTSLRWAVLLAALGCHSGGATSTPAGAGGGTADAGAGGASSGGGGGRGGSGGGVGGGSGGAVAPDGGASEAGAPSTPGPPTVQDFHLTARPWAPLDLPRDRYLRNVEGVVRAMMK